VATVNPYAYFTLACRLVIGGLFLYACVHKIADPLGFAVSIRNYMVLPVAWSNIVAITLPWIELGAGLFLILGIQTKPAALLTTTMLAVFLGALIYAYAIGLDIDCGCFSTAAESQGRVGPYHLVRDTALFLASLSILLTDNGDFSVSGLFPARGVRPESA
jgi:putative oxidoreductase